MVDGLILTTNGFSVFKNAETKRLLVELGKKRGIIVLTDSDDAGFRIRNYVNKLAQGICVKNAYVPAIAGKERRKAQPSKEGVLGVEGVPSEAILRALQTAGAREKAKRAGRAITYTDLYELARTEGSGVARPRKALACRRAFPKKRCARCSTACTLMRNSYRPCRETVLR
ncbi:MAG: toprim domain-containing protein [Ruthenibacterium lactatiformans]